MSKCGRWLLQVVVQSPLAADMASAARPFQVALRKPGWGLYRRLLKKSMKCNFVVNIRFPAGCSRSSRLLLGFGRRNPSSVMGHDKPEEALDGATMGKCPQR